MKPINRFGSTTLLLNLVLGVVILITAAGCAAKSDSVPIELSQTEPSLLFFYTDN